MNAINTEVNLKKDNSKRKIWTLLLVAFITLGFLFNILRLPVNMADWFVPFSVEKPSYIPISVDKKHAKVIILNRVKIVYENENETLTVWATSDIGWNKVSNWDEMITLQDGTTAYYNDTDDKQMISWRLGKVEYAVDYEGNSPLSKEEMIKIASSIK